MIGTEEKGSASEEKREARDFGREKENRIEGVKGASSEPVQRFLNGLRGRVSVSPAGSKDTDSKQVIASLAQRWWLVACA